MLHLVRSRLTGREGTGAGGGGLGVGGGSSTTIPIRAVADAMAAEESRDPLAGLMDSPMFAALFERRGEAQ